MRAALLCLLFLTPVQCGAPSPTVEVARGALTTGAGWNPSQWTDPQIAAGPSQVLVSAYENLYYYDKDGNPITTDVHGVPLAPDVKTLVRYLWDTTIQPHPLNDYLNLPSGAHCDRNHPFDQPIASGTYAGQPNYCVDQYYDARVLYDNFRDRFVVVASANNSSSKCTAHSPNPIESARRSKIVVAYSGSSDLADGSGWLAYSFDAVPGEGCTDQACRTAWGYTPGDAADYPVVGINRHYLTITINNAQHWAGDGTACGGNWSASQAAWHVWNADAMATNQWDSTTCLGADCSWVYFGNDLKDSNGNTIGGGLTPARIHGDSYLADGWAIQPSTGSYTLWHFPMNGTTKPPLQRKTITVPSFSSSAPTHWDLVNQGTGSAPAYMKIDAITSFVGRNQNLYVADVGSRVDGSWNGAGVRLVELLGGSNPSPVLGRTQLFGAQQFIYGSPALDVDSTGNMAVTFRRASASSPSEARYAIWYAGDSALSGGQSLHTGSGTFPSASSGSCSTDDDCHSEDKICHSGSCWTVSGRWDTAGISLGPNGTRFYMLQPYAAANKSWGNFANWVTP